MIKRIIDGFVMIILALLIHSGIQCAVPFLLGYGIGNVIFEIVKGILDRD